MAYHDCIETLRFMLFEFSVPSLHERNRSTLVKEQQFGSECSVFGDLVQLAHIYIKCLL